MTPYPAQDAGAIRRGYEQYAPPPVPPGMYFDRRSGLVLPQGVQPRRIGQVVAAYALAVLLYLIGTVVLHDPHDVLPMQAPGGASLS